MSQIKFSPRILVVLLVGILVGGGFFFLPDGMPNQKENLLGIKCAAAASSCTSLKTGVSATYYTSATDPDGDRVKILFDWGDGKSTTTGLKASGSSFSASHSWSKAGTYYVKTRTIDDKGAVSGWSGSLKVTVTGGGDGGGGGEAAFKITECRKKSVGLYASWEELKGAYSYKVHVTRPDQTKKTYSTNQLSKYFPCKGTGSHKVQIEAVTAASKTLGWSDERSCMCY